MTAAGVWTGAESESEKVTPATSGVRQPVQPHTFYAWLLVFDETLAQPHFAVISDVAMSVFYPPVLMCSLIFLQLWTAVS